jgi:hypothetical protein
MDVVQRDDDAFEGLLLLAQRLAALGIVPDGGVFEFPVDLFELQRLGVEVKDTSGVRPRAGRGRRGGWRCC